MAIQELTAFAKKELLMGRRLVRFDNDNFKLVGQAMMVRFNNEWIERIYEEILN